MEENEKNDPGSSIFYNNYPRGWEEFQDLNSKHYFISVPSEPGRPKVTVEIRFTPLYSWGRYEIQVRLYGKMYNEYNFMQTKSYEGEQSILDRAWEYNNGFYYNNDDLDYYSDNYFRQGSDGYFQDRPNAFYFDAELTVFGRRNNSWENIQTYSWGYSILNGTLSDYFRLNSNPSITHQNYIRKVLNQWNNK